MTLPADRPNRDPDLLFPPMRQRLVSALGEAHARGLMAYPFEGYRVTPRQVWLYAQGRTRPGPVVTNARPGWSWHEYGVAVDLVFDGDERPGIQWSWDGDYVGTREADYRRVGEVMMRHGFEWYGHPGADFFEMPHFQMTWGLTVVQARKLMETGGLAAVWEELHRRIGGS